jgi:hypothetical protein
MPSGGTYYPYYSRHYLHSPHAPVYYGANEMPTQQQPAYAQPGFAPLYHNATYQRPER